MKKASTKRLLKVVSLFMAVLVLFGATMTFAAAEGEATGMYGGKIYEVYPGDDYKAVYNQLQPGDELVFHEGVYKVSEYATGSTLLYLSRSGEPDKPIVLRGYGEGEARPVFLQDIDNGRNMCELGASNVVMKYLEMQPVAGGPRGIRIKGRSNNIVIDDCVFRNCVQGSISANDGNTTYDNIAVTNCKFIGIEAIPVYIGEHSGSTIVTNFLFEKNYIEGSRISKGVGYGIELKLNVKGGIVKNNLILNTQGPGIMVYGTKDMNPADASLIENNIVAGSRSNEGILVGAGAAVVRNNLTLANAYMGIRVYDYGSRGYLGNVTVTGNTSIYNKEVDLGLTMPSSYVPQNLNFTDNLVIVNEGGQGYSGIPAELEGWTISGNKEITGDSELDALVAGLITDGVSDEDSIDKVWPHLNKLKHGPTSMDEVKYLLGKLLQKME